MELEDLIADRIGRVSFGKKNKSYKFEVIKSDKMAAEMTNPERVILDFGIGEPPMPPDKKVIDELYNAAKDPSSGHYTDCGMDFFIRSACRYMERVFGVALDPEREVLPSMGIKSSLVYVAHAFLNPKDVLLTTTPGYPVLPTYARYLGAEVYFLPLREENNFFPDLEAIPPAILQRAKILHLNYPNNPTGACATKEFFTAAVEFAHKHALIIVHDAAYSGLYDDRNGPISLLNIPNGKAVSLELHSCSKAQAMTGWRIGWVCGNETFVEAYRTVKNSSDSGVFLPIQSAACLALEDAAFPQRAMQYYRTCAAAIREILEPKGFRFPTDTHPFYLYTPVPKSCSDGTKFESALDFSKWLLNELGVVTVPWDDVVPSIRLAMTFSTPFETTVRELRHRIKTVEFQW